LTKAALVLPSSEGKDEEICPPTRHRNNWHLEVTQTSL